MPVIKNIACISEILAETDLLPAPVNGKANKKDQFIQALSQRGVDQNSVADAVASQLYSSDENVKDKAIERYLKLTEIIKPDGVNNIPTINIQINGFAADASLNPILVPREQYGD